MIAFLSSACAHIVTVLGDPYVRKQGYSRMCFLVTKASPLHSLARLQSCCRLDGRAIVTPCYYCEESPGSMDTLPVNTWAHEAKATCDGKCHRKQTAGVKAPVRVKRRGKSSPHLWQHEWLGKPQWEQGQINGERTSTSFKTPWVDC